MSIVDDEDIPYIEGSDLTVIDAYHQYVDGRDPAHIADDYGVKLARIHEAIAYYCDHAERMMRLETESPTVDRTGDAPSEDSELTDCGGWRDNIETTRWELVKWICPTCIDDYDPHKSDLSPSELAPVDTSDPDIDKKAVWGIGPDYDGFDYELWQEANNVDPLVYCRECDSVFKADFTPVSPADVGLSESPREEAIRRARELKRDLKEEELRGRIEKLDADLEMYQKEYGHDSPEEADQFGDIADEDVNEWAMTRADKTVAKLALRLVEAEPVVMESATAGRDDWEGTTPSDAGEALFGDGPDEDDE